MTDLKRRRWSNYFLSLPTNQINKIGIKYKIRITEHLNNLILRDSSNAKLAIGVISDVASVQNFKILDGSESENKRLASGVILSPKGTILHGNLSLDLEKRPKIKIYYTEPED